jgi:hypothetical protein
MPLGGNVEDSRLMDGAIFRHYEQVPIYPRHCAQPMVLQVERWTLSQNDFGAATQHHVLKVSANSSEGTALEDVGPRGRWARS